MTTVFQTVPFLKRVTSVTLHRMSSLLQQSTSVRTYASKKRCDPGSFIQPHMNELPVACHPFHQHYKSQQRQYNMVLLGGILTFIGSFIFMKSTGAFEMYASPPSEPSPPTRVREQKKQKDIKEPKC